MRASKSDDVQRPNRWLLAAEGPRAVGERVLLQAAKPLLAGVPRGDGHTVLVLPGLGAGDRSTVALRRFLRRLGYRVHGWGSGANLPSRDVLAKLRARVAELSERESQPMSLVGWSLGGIYARRIARADPTMVRNVITLGSPFRPVPGLESDVAPAVRLTGRDLSRWWSGVDRPLPMPSTSVFTRTDGVVPWQACVDRTAGDHETIEVLGSHCGLGHHPAVLFVIADRLAQPADAWQPLRIPTPWRPLLRHHTDG